MNHADKGNQSFEGHGLSVSEHPDAWTAIAGLGGLPRWALERSGSGEPAFLDWHRADVRLRDKFLAWGCAQGLCEPCRSWVMSYTDCDTEDEREMHFDDEGSAHVEADQRLEEKVRADVVERPGWRLAPSALAALSRDEADLCETQELVAILWAERCTDLDGVYWGDRLDPAALSAPRAVIFPSRLDRWSVEEQGRTQVRRRRMRG